MTLTKTAPETPAAAYAAGPRYAGLDGLRAIAVLLVLIYHLFPAWWVQQGFIGVDVFFVISGFLITSLLLRETDATGRIAYVDFWRRRARRLIPAIIVLIGVSGLWGWIIGGDVLVGFGRQVLGALTFSYNWVSLASGEGYFDQANPEILRNLWSLAVEEQFYVLWPVLLPLLLLISRRWVRTAVALTAVVASAGWMAVIVGGGGDLTRAYFGTDSHGFGILLGVALAFALHRPGDRGATQAHGAPWTQRPVPRWAIAALGVAAIGGLIAVALGHEVAGIATFPGALLAASVLAAIVIAAAVQPGSPLGAALDVAPMRWIGVRSYGIYLWHWPVLVLLMAGFVGAGAETGVPVWLGATTLAITVVASALSYRFIEEPIRRYGFRGTARRIGRGLVGAPASRFAAAAAVSGLVLAACATTGAIASAPAETAAERAVAAGAAALATASATPAPSEASTPSDASDASSSPDPTASASAPPEPGQTPSPDASVAPSPQPTPVSGAEVSAVGDSVMLASAGGLLERLPGVQVDAAVSRSMWAAPTILEGLAASGQLRPYVVVALGTNGPVDAGALQRVADIVGPDRHLVLVNAYAPRNWIPGVNEALARFANANPGVVVADWSGTADANLDLLAGDRIHPGPAGGRAYAETVAAAVQGIEDARALAEFRELQAHERATEIALGRPDMLPR